MVWLRVLNPFSRGQRERRPAGVSKFPAAILVMAIVCVFGFQYAYAQEQPAAPGPGISQGDSVAKTPSADQPDLQIQFPDFEWDGGDLEWRRWSWFFPGIPLPDTEEIKTPKVGMWLEGRVSWLGMPLSDRLKPITRDRGIDAFDDYLLMMGPQLTLSINDSFWISSYFDTGYMTREDKVSGEKRRAEVNATRLGMRVEVNMPLSFYFNALSLEAPDLGPLPGIGSVRTGMALEMGLGNLNLVKKGDDLPLDRRVNMPFLYITPMATSTLPWSDYAAIDFYAGYSLVTVNSLSQEFYFDDKRMIKGADFNGWVAGIRLRFGIPSVRELLPRKAEPNEP